MFFQRDAEPVPSETGNDDAAQPLESTPGRAIQKGDAEDGERVGEEVALLCNPRDRPVIRFPPANGRGEGAESSKIQRKVSGHRNQPADPGPDRAGDTPHFHHPRGVDRDKNETGDEAETETVPPARTRSLLSWKWFRKPEGGKERGNPDPDKPAEIERRVTQGEEQATGRRCHFGPKTAHGGRETERALGGGGRHGNAMDTGSSRVSKAARLEAGDTLETESGDQAGAAPMRLCWR